MLAISEAYRDIECDLDQLVAVTATLVAASGVIAEDGRVSGVPDARAVRYYRTLGVLSRPLRYEGRRAVYGYRHLLELVAVKSLQARGLSLAQVQRAIAGVTAAQLESAIADTLPVVPPPAPAPRGEARELIAAEVAPGIVVTVDPACVADPADAIARIRSSVAHRQGVDE